MRILLTGAAGFIGSYVARALLEKGYEVLGLDNLNAYYDVRLKFYRLSGLLAQKNFHFFPVDISDWVSLAALFKRIGPLDAVINLAARAGVRASLEEPLLYHHTNATGSLHLLELMRHYQVPRYVLASTSSLYAGTPMPFTEDQPVNTPISPYAASKKAAEVMAYTYHKHYGIHVSILRYFTVYGPAGRPDMSIFRFIEWIYRGQAVEIYGDGKQSRDFTFVEDVAQATVAALRLEGYTILNIGGGRAPTSLLEVVEFIERSLNKKAKLNFLPPQRADLVHTQADITRAQTLLGWQPQVDFYDGLAYTLKWHISNRALLDNLTL
ncbi:MAG: SDR family NAD(P)-dependent oxidoreductase [Bacteroidia bacterium]